MTTRPLWLTLAVLILSGIACSTSAEPTAALPEPTQPSAATQAATEAPQPTTAPTDAPAAASPTQIASPTLAATSTTSDGSPAPAPTSTPVGLTDFRNNLLNTIVSERVAAALRPFMGAEFIIMQWPAQTQQPYPSDQAATVLQTDYYIPIYGELSFDWGDDYTSLLGGTDPKLLWGEDVIAADVLFMDGWGVGGNGEALLIVVFREDGGYDWHSVIFDADGF